MSEKSFQNYWMKIGKPLNHYRIALVNGTGFPDILALHGPKHSLIELKDFALGKRGDKKIAPLFKPSQFPWYIKYFQNGGTRLFVAFRICDHDESNKRYGLWHLTKEQVLHMDDLYYSDLSGDLGGEYKEYSSCKTMIEDIEKWGENR